MEFQRQTSRRLHEEHGVTLELMERLERVFTGRSGIYPPPDGDSNWPDFAGRLLGAIEYEVARHFEFEEKELFPHLERAGDGDLAQLLAEEHQTIREAAQPLTLLMRKALAGGAQPEDWQTMKVLALAFSERLASHAQKEETALLPVLDDVLDERTDSGLLENYTSG